MMGLVLIENIYNLMLCQVKIAKRSFILILFGVAIYCTKFLFIVEMRFFYINYKINFLNHFINKLNLFKLNYKFHSSANKLCVNGKMKQRNTYD
jgi:hypothetical protein